MRILMLAQCEIPIKNGMGTRVYEFSENLSKRGHEVFILCSKRNKHDPSHSKIGNINVFRVYEPRQFNRWASIFMLPMFIVKALIICTKHKINITHAHMYYGGLAALALNKVTKTPFVFDYHGPGIEEYILCGVCLKNGIGSSIIKNIDRILLTTANALLVIHDSMSQYIQQARKIVRKTYVIGNGVNLRTFDTKTADSSTVEKKYGKNIILHVGLLEQWAGGDIILKSIKLFNEKNNKFKFIFLGDGPKLNYLIDQTKVLGLKNVVFAGRVNYSEVKNYIAASTVCLLAFPFNEVNNLGFPIKIFEYFALKKPVICTYTAPLKDLFSQYDCGIVVGKNDCCGMAQSLLHLVEDANERGRLGENGFQLTKNTFNWEAITEKLERVYKNVIRENI